MEEKTKGWQDINSLQAKKKERRLADKGTTKRLRTKNKSFKREKSLRGKN